MEISAVMNIQELAVNKAVRLHADAQERQEKINQQKELQAASETGVLNNKMPLEKDITALSNTAQQQLDPQLTSSKVEKQVDTQAAKEMIQGAEGKNTSGESIQETGSLVDIVT